MNLSLVNKRVEVLVICMMVTIFLLSGIAEAIGVTPARKTISFEPGYEQIIRFSIVNNDHKKFNAFVYVDGELKDYIKIEKNIVSFEEWENSKEFEYNIRLPDSFDKPGDHWGKIVIVEMPPDFEDKNLEGQFVIATTGVVHQILVKVPYPGKFAQVKLSIDTSEPGEITTFYVKVYNLGEESIYSAKATIDILGPTNERITSLESDEISIDAKRKEDIVLQWKADVNPGRYLAKVTLVYDGKTATAEKIFEIGSKRVEILGVNVKNFILGGVAKFEIDVKNEWNQELKNVYATLEITTEDGDRIATVKSPSTNIPPLQRSTLYAYWDTQGVEKGTYMTRLIIHYDDKTTEKLIKTYVNIDSIQTEFSGVTAKVLTSKAGESGGLTVEILVPLVLVLVIINLGWFIHFRKR